MKIHIYLLIIIVTLAACQNVEKQSTDVAGKDDSSITVNILKNIDGTFGYEIMVDGKKKIIQPMVPAVQGQHGFKNMQDAFSTAELAVKKLKSGEMPPVITLEELTLLGVLYW